MKKEEGKALRRQLIDLLVRIDHEDGFAGQLLAASNFQIEHRKLAEHLIKGTCEQRAGIDRILEQRLPKGLASLPAFTRAALRLAVYQLKFSTSVTAALVVDETVNVVKGGKYSGFSKLVNAVLRSVLRDEELDERAFKKNNEPDDLAHPEWMLRRWRERYGDSETRQLCEYNNSHWPLNFRFDPARISSSELKKLLEDDGVLVEPGKYLSRAFRVTKLPADKRLENLKAFTEGFIQVQDESSMLVIELLNPQPGERILDLCSAPGGKTTDIAQRVTSSGKVQAVEIHQKKLRFIKENCERLKLENVAAVCADGIYFQDKELFDRVLVDAPCSGLGVLGRKSEMRWRKSENDFDALEKLQISLLENAATLTKPGGFLVYSTCSIEPQENFGTVKHFLEKNTGFELVPVNRLPSELIDENGCFQSLPHRHFIGGAFAALLQRKQSILV